MTSRDLVEVANCANELEAEQLRGLLEEVGIAAFIDGAAVNTMMSHVGTALGGVRVLVESGHEQPARELVASLGSGGEPWYCCRCREQIEGNFDVCWSCGQPRSQVESPRPRAPEADQPADEYAGDQSVQPAASIHVNDARLLRAERGDYDHANPYASPRAPQAVSRDEPDAVHPDAEAMLLRAWRAAIIGLLLLPVILQLYSMWLLIRAAMLTSVFTPEGQRRYYGAMALNVLGGGLWIALFRGWLTPF